ncbi:MAG: hypothetical protein JNG86_13070 [Verrucomicrobiaceae bacterium]|nr:hypothetical protein [Verrucomicrobiaceae bacterium]
MKTLVTLSRAFVEFGPFTKTEILDFNKRGLLQDTDHLRDEGTDAWLHLTEWLTTAQPAPKLKVVKTPKAAAPKKSKKAA